MENSPKLNIAKHQQNLLSNWEISKYLKEGV
jgi:hypothetical protein